MTRPIAILTLNLAIAHSAQAFPHIVTFDGFVAHEPELAISTSRLSPGDCVSAYDTVDDLDALIAEAMLRYDHLVPASDTLRTSNPTDCTAALQADFGGFVQFVAYEYGPEAAYLMLLDMGFHPAEAESLCQDVTYEW